ncbi:MAG: ATP-binding protein [Acetobacteraceae bacterium]|nr:ATP-binding protein [Acetobacteraceae bacterium]MDW8399237.1 ATP-binding protein [Acetobacteraceae bacterium]
METATRRGGASIRHRLQRADGSWLPVRTTFRLLQRMPQGGADLAGYLEDDTADRRALERTLAAARLAQAGAVANDLLPAVRRVMAGAAAAEGSSGPQWDAVRAPMGDLDRPAALSAPAGSGRGVADLRAALEDALALLRPRLDRAEASAVAEVEEELPPVAMPAPELTRLLLALLTNSVQAIERAGTEDRRIRVSVWRDTASGRIHASVADTAGGIPSAIVERVFDPFVSTLPSAENLGFGLTLARTIAEQAGATLSVQNEAGGVAARLTFPSAASRPADEAGQADAKRAVAGIPRFAG